MAKNKQKVSVLAFEKKIVPSDGYMFGTVWEKRNNSRTPLGIREKSVRGTISNSLKSETPNNPMKLSANIQDANPHTVDCCFLDIMDDTLVVNFTVKFLGNLANPSACNNSEFLQKYAALIDEYSKEFGFTELAFRYAYNLACARFLWRNRLGSEYIEVVVRDCSDDESWTFNAKSFDLRDFEKSKEAELSGLAKKIADTFVGVSSSLFEVTCFAKIGKAQEVYPSEEMVLSDKGKNDKKNDKSKILYSINGNAAFHSQKIGNAIRTIDTWYPAFKTVDGVGPIAVDSYGPVTTISKAFRSEKNTDFYSIKDSYVWGDKPIGINEKHFFIAMIIRGGVFGESSKE